MCKKRQSIDLEHRIDFFFFFTTGGVAACYMIHASHSVEPKANPSLNVDWCWKEWQRSLVCVFIQQQEEVLLATAQALEPAKHTLQQEDLCAPHYDITIFLH